METIALFVGLGRSECEEHYSRIFGLHSIVSVWEGKALVGIGIASLLGMHKLLSTAQEMQRGLL